MLRSLLAFNCLLCIEQSLLANCYGECLDTRSANASVTLCDMECAKLGAFVNHSIKLCHLVSRG
jgi:hypothetical protein